MALEAIAHPDPAVRQWPPPQGEWTYADYARLPDNGARYEVIRGELHMTPAPSTRHQIVTTTLASELYVFVKERDLGNVIASPIDVNISDLANPVQPDIVFITQERLEIVGKQTVEGAPDLVVEVLSPGTATRDRRDKFHLYAEAGVREYWLVDPDECTIEIFVLRGQAYAQLGRFGRDEQTRSEVLPDFSLTVTDTEICPD